MKCHKECFCIGYESTFKQMLVKNKWYRRAFYGYIVGVVIVSTWVLSLIFLQ